MSTIVDVKCLNAATPSSYCCNLMKMLMGIPFFKETARGASLFSEE